MKKTIAALAVGMMAVAGCSSPEEPDTEPVEQVEEVEATQEPEQEPAPDEAPAEAPDEAEEAESEVTADSDNELPIEPQTVETGGFILTVENLGYLSREDLGADADGVLLDDTQTVMAINVTVENTTEDTLGFYPDQATMVVGSEQLEAQFFMSEQVGGDFLGPVTKEGIVMFESSLTQDEIRELGEVRYVVDGPHDEDFERTGEDVDLTLTW